MQSNDVQVVRLYTSSVAGGTLDDTPAEVGGNPRATFYLMVQADAGDEAGDNKLNYTLTISARSTSGGATTFAKQNLKEEVGDVGKDWKQVTPGQNDGYVKQSTIAIRSADFPGGDVYEFIATLRLESGRRTTVRSNEFYTF